MLRVMIVEDDAELRADLARTLGAHGTGLEVVASVGRAAAALKAAADRRPQCSLVDLGLPGASGIELLAELREASPDSARLVLTVFDDRETVLAALAAGATGYLLKDAPRDELIRAVRGAALGEAPLSPRIARVLLDAWQRTAMRAQSPLSPEPLTVRESHVLSALAQGASYAAVAAELGISLGTVQGYVKNIYGKLHVTSKTQAVLVATKLGLLR